MDIYWLEQSDSDVPFGDDWLSGSPDGGALPIEYRDVLRAAHKTDEEISAVEEALDYAALVEQVLV